MKSGVEIIATSTNQEELAKKEKLDSLAIWYKYAPSGCQELIRFWG